MGITDKITGRVKKAAGDLTDDARCAAKGRQEERKGEAKEELARDQERPTARPRRSRTSSARPDLMEDPPKEGSPGLSRGAAGEVAGDGERDDRERDTPDEADRGDDGQATGNRPLGRLITPLARAAARRPRCRRAARAAPSASRTRVVDDLLRRAAGAPRASARSAGAHTRVGAPASVRPRPCRARACRPGAARPSGRAARGRRRGRAASRRAELLDRAVGAQERGQRMPAARDRRARRRRDRSRCRHGDRAEAPDGRATPGAASPRSASRRIAAGERRRTAAARIV